MTASSRGNKAVASLIRYSQHPRICSDCIATAPRSRRTYATAAAAVQSSSDAGNAAHIPPATASSQNTVVKSGILLSRPPLITRNLTPFENAFYFYQKRLNERLAIPFTRYFYFKKDTPADNDWKRKAKERNGAAARELGGYQAYGELGWNDEVLLNDSTSSPKAMVEALVKDAAVKGDEESAEQEEGGVERPLERWTEADKSGDVKRLDRKLARTLYLCVKGEKGDWTLPAGTLEGRENLHQAAERILVQSAGINMNTWIVGKAPIGFYKRQAEAGPVEKTFFLKGRIMAGQADLKENQFGLKDFMWLTKQEIEKHVDGKFYHAIKNMMSDR